eukprot:c11469_g1_i1.p1 GENE.c11469_g1_i1~~c11469_g1_i1.p1  ORF type:complete len:510 (-),score=104.03 c11469_g1_i1:228-1697(-)
MASEVDDISQHMDKPKKLGPTKRGRLHKRGARRKNWLERSFVLDKNELYYLKSDNDSKRQGEVPLDANWSCQKWDIDNRKNAFIVQNPYGGRSFYCDAPSIQARDEWIEAINQTIACIGGAGMFDDLTEDKRASADEPSTSVNTDSIALPSGKDKVGLTDFELKAVLGKGSFGKVMLVQRRETQEVFAMKVLRKEAIIAGNQVQHTRAERSILQEVDCPFIVKLHYAFQTQGKLYLILDYVRGGELFFQLKREGLFSEERVRLYTAEIILALQHLHDKNIVYRDLKPENLLLDVEGHIMLTDFGLSKEAVVRKNGARTFCGTPEYLAPEILKGVGHGKAVDWWSLGTLMYEMLTGLPPFYSQNRKVMFERILKAELTFPSHIKPEARHILSALLTRDPDKRLGSGPGDANDIRTHPFFAPLDWNMVIRREYKPAYTPEVKDVFDTSNFDPEYTEMPVADSLVGESAITEAANANFDGFTYVAKSKLNDK